MAGQLGEPLTGRQVSLRMYPVSQLELREHLEEHLIYGGYPEVVTAASRADKEALLDEIVGSYLLEKGYVLFNIRGYSRNLRKEITKKSKYYFYDTGIRNAVIANFNGIDLRDDVGRLWENFLFVERLKLLAYRSVRANHYFWRTWDGQEIDMVEERGGRQDGYEFKWGTQRPAPPADWSGTYPEATYSVITRENSGCPVTGNMVFRNPSCSRYFGMSRYL